MAYVDEFANQLWWEHRWSSFVLLGTRTSHPRPGSQAGGGKHALLQESPTEHHAYSVMTQGAA